MKHTSSTDDRKESEQKSKPQALVCFVDILGFENKSRKWTIEAEKDARSFLDILQKCILGPKVKGKLGRRFYQTPRFSAISDAVFIYLALIPDPSIAANDSELLVRGLSSVLYQCIKKCIPVRGSISIGEAKMEQIANMDGTFLVGIPVTDAATFEHSQEWVGISIVPTTNNHSIIEALIKRNAITKWGIPTESGLQESYAVNWPEENLDRGIEYIREFYNVFLKGGNIERCRGESTREIKANPNIAAKYYSTLVFLEHQKKPMPCDSNGEQNLRRITR